MKILIAIGVPRQKEAGAAGVVLNHARELEKRGHRVDCWFLDDVLEKPARPKRFEALIFGVRVAKRVLRERNRYDVVNLHAPWGCAYGVWRRLRHLAGSPPYVLTMQGSEERYARTMRREQDKGRVRNFGWKNRLWERVYHQTMFDYSIRTADYGAVANREAWICAELKYDSEPGKIRFIPNGVEGQFFTEREYTAKSPLRLLYVGTWLDRKGVFYLASAFQLLIRSTPVRLTIAGCGSSEQRVKRLFRAGSSGFRRRHPVCRARPHARSVRRARYLRVPIPVRRNAAHASRSDGDGHASGDHEHVRYGRCRRARLQWAARPPADAESLARSIGQVCESTEMRCQLGREAQNTMRRYTWSASRASWKSLDALTGPAVRHIASTCRIRPRASSRGAASRRRR